MARTKTQQEFLDQARRVHGNKYDYSKTAYRRGTDMIVITCPSHGDFCQLASSHLRAGCARCPRHSNIDQGVFEKRASAVHSGKYSYKRAVYSRSSAKLVITCPVHGDFEQYPQNHLRGQGCRKCTNLLKSSSTGQWIQAAIDRHGEKYEYDKVKYTGHKDLVNIGCSKHGDFWQNAGSHLQGSGCPRCRTNRISKPSLIWLEAMSTLDNTYVQHGGNGGEVRLAGTRMHADGFSAELNKVYEFLGNYYHGNPRKYAPDTVNKTSKRTMGDLYERTCKRRKLIEDLGYDYEEIWEDEMDAVKALLDLGTASK